MALINNKILENMDQSAIDAENDLKNIDIATITVVANWMKNHYLNAGYKRLCKILLKYANI